MKQRIANWGNFPHVEAEIHEALQPPALARTLAGQPALIARGLGRSYGDASLGKHVWNDLPRNRILSFDAKSGLLTCEGGVSLEEILRVFVPRGWFLPVTPGTKFVTLGGAIASDVHGKNHHAHGSFCRHVVRIRLMLSDGRIVEATPTTNADLFRATAGGMGLTGLILDASFYLKRIETSFIKQISYRARNLDEMFRLIDEHGDVTYTVSWMDCLQRGKNQGRGILFTGEHAALSDLNDSQRHDPLAHPHRLKLAVPFMLPGFVLNPMTVKAFNLAVYGTHPWKVHTSIVDYDKFFYPLDSIHHWNRIYGPRGFVQYQFVLPEDRGYDGMVRVLDEISKRGLGSFLVVFKKCGDPASFSQAGMQRSKGGSPSGGAKIGGKVPVFPLSFPMKGYSLALDFAIRPGLMEFLDHLDELIQSEGGRVYLTKDARMKPKMLRRQYPAVKEFERIRKQLDPKRHIRSHLSERLGL